MAFKLVDLMLNRVDLCGAGANPDAHIVLYKSKEDTVPQPKKKTAKAPARKAKGKADSRSKSKQRGDEEEEEEEDDAVTKNEDDDDDDEDDGDDDAVVDEDEEEDDDGDSGARAKSKKPAKKPAKGKKVAKADDDDDISDDDADEDDDFEEIDERVLKALPRAAREQIERSQRIAKRASERAKQAHELAIAEKTRREHLEFVEKAKKDIPLLPGTDEENGELMQALYSGRALDKKEADKIVKLLKSGNKAMESMMAESGRQGIDADDDDSPIAQLKSLAKDIREENPKLSEHQAFDKACRDNPKLYAQYKTEKRRRTADVM